MQGQGWDEDQGHPKVKVSVKVSIRVSRIWVIISASGLMLRSVLGEWWSEWVSSYDSV